MFAAIRTAEIERLVEEDTPPSPQTLPIPYPSTARLYSSQIAAGVDSLTSAGQLTSAAPLFNQAPVQTPPSGNIWAGVLFADFPSGRAKIKFPFGQSDDDWQQSGSVCRSTEALDRRSTQPASFPEAQLKWINVYRVAMCGKIHNEAFQFQILRPHKASHSLQEDKKGELLVLR